MMSRVLWQALGVIVLVSISEAVLDRNQAVARCLSNE